MLTDALALDWHPLMIFGITIIRINITIIEQKSTTMNLSKENTLFPVDFSSDMFYLLF